MGSVRETIEGAIEVGMDVLTLFAFSTENWNRPQREVSALMSLLQRYARKELDELKRQGVEVHVLGELDRIAESVEEVAVLATFVRDSARGIIR